MSRPTPEELITEWERRKMVKAAERAVIEAAEEWAGQMEFMDVLKPSAVVLLAAVSKLRETRGE
jgi:hypothetical protein